MNSKVYYDLAESPLIYNHDGFSFVFSSEANKRKFINKLEDFKKQETLYLSNRYYHVKLNFDLFLTIALYKKLERRGFRIFTDDNVTLSEDTLFLVCYKSYGKHF